MKNKLLLIGLVAFISCNNTDTDTDSTDGGDTTYLPAEVIPATTEIPKVNKMIWSASYDSARKDVIVKQNRQVKADTLTAENVIEDINASWDDIKLKLKRVGHDTIYVAIPESESLTQGLGSSGAYGYMGGVTYSLTELPNIKYVNYDFIEGDHLSPGTKKRSDFKH